MVMVVAELDSAILEMILNYCPWHLSLKKEITFLISFFFSFFSPFLYLNTFNEYITHYIIIYLQNPEGFSLKHLKKLMISNIKGREILKINLTLLYIRVTRNKECIITFVESWF
jgi:hypothetical protein